MYLLSTGTSLFQNCASKWGENAETELFDYAVSHGRDSCHELSVLKSLDFQSDDVIHIVYPSAELNVKCACAITRFLEQSGFCCVFGHQITIGSGKTVASRQKAFTDYLHGVMNILWQSRTYMTATIILDDQALFAMAAMLATLLSGVPLYRHDNICDSPVKIPPLPVSFDRPLFEQWQSSINELLGQKHQLLNSSALPESLRNIFTVSKGEGLVLNPIGLAICDTSRIRTSADVPVSNVKSHATLFGPGSATKLSEVPSEPFRRLCGMIKRLCPNVSEFLFDTFDFNVCDPVGCAEFAGSGRGWVKYAFKLPDGRQFIKVMVPADQEKRARAAIGSRIQL